MRIGLLTFLDVANFGANLQASSTYYYLKNMGHEVIAIRYESYKTVAEKILSRLKRKLLGQPLSVQGQAHHEYVMTMLENQTKALHTNRQVAAAIREYKLDGVIIGSDAVAQHWPICSTWQFKMKRPFWIEPLQAERRFPNPFWGIGFADKVPTAMMSVSSQNSKYYSFRKFTLRRMAKQLHLMKYISVRDAWTKEMMLHADSSLDITVTPDPVFALNQNLKQYIPSEEQIRSKYSLPAHYVLIGMRSQVYTCDELSQLNELFKKEGKECVAFNIDGVYNYTHPFNYTIPLPLSPLDWFALIKYASAYIGSNMHPIVSSLTNAVPCVSLDNWGIVDFWGRRKEGKSSKVYDVLSQYGLSDYWIPIKQGRCEATIDKLVALIDSFPVVEVRRTSEKRLYKYNNMMDEILQSIQEVNHIC